MKVCSSVHAGSSLQAAEGGAWAGACPPEGPLPGLTLVKERLPPPRSRPACPRSRAGAAAITHHPGPVLSCDPPCPLGWQHSLPHQAEAEPNSGPKLSALKHPQSPAALAAPGYKPAGPRPARRLGTAR